MNSEIMARIKQLKHYINAIDQSVTKKNYKSALNTIGKVKKSIKNNQSQNSSNSFLFDCQKAKNQKLKLQIKNLQDEKANIQKNLSLGKKGHAGGMKDIKIGAFISRFPLKINDCRKIDYDEIVIRCDYQKISFRSDEENTKYKQYVIPIPQLLFHEQRLCYIYLNCKSQNEQQLHCVFKFQNEKEASKWICCVSLAKIIQNNRTRKKLFLKESPPRDIATSNLSEDISTFQFSNKPATPPESLNTDRKSADRSAQKSDQRYNQKSFASVIGIINPKDFRNSAVRRLDINRPPFLNRVRGRSQNIDHPLQISKIYKSSNIRKASEDIFKPHINQIYHEKMLEKYRSQKELQIEAKSESINNFKKKDQNPLQSSKSSKIKFLEDKKKELLKQTDRRNLSNIEKPSFAFDSKVSWMGIQQMDDENKSKSSNVNSAKSRRQSQITDSINHSNTKKQGQISQSHKIYERSEEQSPKFPQKLNYDVPHKISYADGTVFRLRPVDRSQLSIHQTQDKFSISRKLKDKIEQHQKSSMSEENSDQHLDFSSHQNHTQSEDNSQRVEELKKGIILTKCAEGGFWPRQKILYLSQNQNELCSRDFKDKKIKKIKINNIQSVDYKKFDKGIIKHISKIQEDKCLLIKALAEQNKIKNFEFVGNLAEPLERFANNLKLFVEYVKKT